MALVKDLVAAGMFIDGARSVLGSYATGITASTTQTQAGGTALVASNNVIGTCANSNDAVTLPDAGRGSTVFVRNNGAQTAKVFPPVGAAINGGSANAAVTLAAGATAVFRYFTDLVIYS